MLKEGKKSDWKFSSSFYVKGKLTSTLTELGKALGLIQTLKQISRGSYIRYELLGEGKGKQVVEFDGSSVRLVFYFNEASKREYSACLVKFLSILALVNDHYTFDVKQLYSYMIESLKWSLPYTDSTESDPKVVARLSWNLKNMTLANASLSHEIFENKIKIENVESELSAYGAFCKKVVDSVTQKNSNILKDLEANFGINEELGAKVCGFVKEIR